MHNVTCTHLIVYRISNIVAQFLIQVQSTLSQVASFIEKGISSAYVNRDQHDKNILSGVINGKFKIVFFTPEMLLLNRNWRDVNNKYMCRKFTGTSC